MIKFIIIVILLLVLFFIFKKDNNKEEFKTNLTFNEKIKLYQCMSATHEMFEKYDIWYVISFGTLLGAVRHRGIIPWDDDIDLLVNIKDMDKLKNALDDLEKLGYKIEKSYKLFRVYSDRDHFIDLFIIDDVDGITQRCYTENKTCKYPPKNAEWWHKLFGFSSKYISNRKIYQYGSLSLWGPSKAFELLKYWYGDNFLTVCETHYRVNHGAETVTPEQEDCKIFNVPQF
jgi:hypothetical protein